QADKATTAPTKTRALAYHALGEAERHRGDMSNAVAHLRTALDIIARDGDRLPRAAQLVRIDLIDALNALEGRAAEAVALARKSVELQRNITSETDDDYAVALERVAFSYEETGDANAALDWHRRAAAIFRLNGSPTSGRVVDVRREIADDLIAV